MSVTTTPPEQAKRRPPRPSGRNLDVYRGVICAQRTQTDVASEFNLSQQRVGQILRQVENWLKDFTPLEAIGWTPEQLLNYATRVAAMKLEYYGDEAIEAWRQSLETHVTHKVRENESRQERIVERIERPGLARTSCLTQARAATAQWARIHGVDMSGKAIRAAALRELEERQLRELAAAPAAETVTKPVAAPADSSTTSCNPLWKSPSAERPGAALTSSSSAAASGSNRSCAQGHLPKCQSPAAEKDSANACKTESAACLSGPITDMLDRTQGSGQSPLATNHLLQKPRQITQQDRRRTFLKGETLFPSASPARLLRPVAAAA